MTVVNQVPSPPLQVPILDQHGRMSRPWAIYNRELYNYLAYKGGNSIDGFDGRITTNSENITANSENISTNSENISTNSENISTNADNIDGLDTDLGAHIAAESAHGSNGNIVGFSDLATELLVGLVRQMDLVDDAVNSSASATGGAATQTPVYVQADVQSIANAANSAASAVNQLVIDVNLVIIQLNDLIAKSKIAGQMNTT